MVQRQLFARRSGEPLGRNALCPCGSGLKFKRCCSGKPIDQKADFKPASDPIAHDGLLQIRHLRETGRFVEAIRLATKHLGQNPKDAESHAELGLLHLHDGQATEAIPYLLQAVRLAPTQAVNHFHLSCVLEVVGRDAEAIAGFRRAVALDPEHTGALEHLGNLMLSYDQRAAALDCFRRIVDLVPDTLLGRINQAKLLVEDGKEAEAEICLRETIAAFPSSGEANRFLATLLREQGRFDEAVPLLEQATEGEPGEAATAYHDLAQSKRITADDTPMLEQMKGLLDYRSLTDVCRMRVHFGLGKSYDDLGQYEVAMRHFDIANRLARRGKSFDRAQFGASVQRTIDTFTAAALADQRHLGSTSQRPVFILGMARSGTTLAEQIISSHPQVGAGGELPFWGAQARLIARQGTDGFSGEVLHKAAAEYEALLQRIAPDKPRITDKMPGNFVWIGLILLAFPNARIIHCRRNPVDTCLSNYFTNFTAPMPFTNDKGDLAFYYRAYERLMAHWRAVVPTENLLEVDYEEVVEDRERVARQMIDFMGLPWDKACLRPEDNRNIVKTASMWQARQPIYQRSTERWRRYEPWLGELRLLLQPAGETPQPVSNNAKLPVAQRLRAAGRFDEAIAVLMEAMRESPHDPIIYSDLGTVCLQANRVDSAIDCFEKAIGLQANFAAAHYNLGAALERAGQSEGAIRALRRAITLAPDLGEAYSRLGNLLQTHGDRPQAVECFQRAQELLARPSDRNLEEAKLLLAEGRVAEAEAKLREVIAGDPANSLAHAMLGDALGELGHFAQARSMLQRATELDPDRIGAYHNFTVLTKITPADRPWIARMEEALQMPGRSPTDRTLLHFALGKAYDDLAEYATAIAHFDAGNLLEHDRLGFDRLRFATRIDRLIETYTPEYFTTAPAADAGDERPLLIVGMPRSGTTLVEQICSSHPRVGAGGELTFWSDRTAGEVISADIAAAAGRDYAALLTRIAPRIDGVSVSRVTDKNPFNFLEIGAVHGALPAARFIHCRRSPIDTCLSIFFTRFATSQPFAYDRADLVFYYRHYQRLMDHWRKVLPPDRLFEIDYEDVVEQQEAATRRLIAFCGLEWDENCLAPQSNQRVVKTASLWQARQTVYRSSVARWRHYEPWLGALRDLPADVT